MPEPDTTPVPLDDVVRVEREIDAPRSEVWEHLSGPEGLEGWLADEVDLELCPGAEGTVTVDGERRPAAVEELVPGRRLGLAWCAPGGEPTLVDLVLDDAGDGRTRITIAETPLRVLRAVGLPADAGALGRGRPTALAGAR
ncbi:SRPBCC domain-containing protein [Patulibacter sp. SYSU D01012]|uniref:SRPBCC family protein n=1 Tax=Patulibacter sp. SYSU D01012 TaxID=2817381 RepID=UPI001B300C15|nr:SRPBCC domain-containing protein [Patulibacter sp. SYSU D01012]